MKKMFRVLTAAFVMGAILVPTAFHAMGAEVSEARAKEIAMEHAGVSSDHIAFIRTELEYEKGRQVYDVEFYTTDYMEYDYEIEVSTGNILSYDYDAEYYQADKAREEGRYRNGTLKAQENPGQVKLEDAKKTALAHAGVSEDQAVFLKTETDYDDGRQVYELEFFTEDFREYDYEIDTESGEIVSYDFEVKAVKETKAGGSPVSAEEAKKIAAAQAGLKVSDVTFVEFEQDYDDGRLTYEGEFLHGTDKYEFDIDASAGAVTDWERESIYD